MTWGVAANDARRGSGGIKMNGEIHALINRPWMHLTRVCFLRRSPPQTGTSTQPKYKSTCNTGSGYLTSWLFPSVFLNDFLSHHAFLRLTLTISTHPLNPYPNSNSNSNLNSTHTRTHARLACLLWCRHPSRWFSHSVSLWCSTPFRGDMIDESPDTYAHPSILPSIHLFPDHQCGGAWAEKHADPHCNHAHPDRIRK